MPRKRTFIASMEKLVIDVATPPGLDGWTNMTGGCPLFITVTDPTAIVDPAAAGVQLQGGGNSGGGIRRALLSHGDDDGGRSSARNGDAGILLLLAAAMAVGTRLFPVTAADFFAAFPTATEQQVRRQELAASGALAAGLEAIKVGALAARGQRVDRDAICA